MKARFLFLTALLLPAVALAQWQRDDRDAKARATEEWKIGYVRHVGGEYKAAVERFRASIEAYPTAEAHTFLAWSLSFLGRLEEAIAHCKSAIELDPEFGNPYNDIGVYLTRLRRADEAPPWFEKAIAARRYCCYHYPLTNLGHLLLAKGKAEEARRLFEKALEHEPKYPPALQGLALARGKQGL